LNFRIGRIMNTTLLKVGYNSFHSCEIILYFMPNVK
jgi:hypothetical protein